GRQRASAGSLRGGCLGAGQECFVGHVTRDGRKRDSRQGSGDDWALWIVGKSSSTPAFGGGPPPRTGRNTCRPMLRLRKPRPCPQTAAPPIVSPRSRSTKRPCSPAGKTSSASGRRRCA